MSSWKAWSVLVELHDHEDRELPSWRRPRLDQVAYQLAQTNDRGVRQAAGACQKRMCTRISFVNSAKESLLSTSSS
eukprot:5417280-Amphidinium_carterae.1